MFINKLVGRYEGVNQAVHVAVSHNLYVPGKKPFEVIISRYSDKNALSSLTTVQRNVLDEITQGKYQGENVGLHGELNFHEKRIKNMQLDFNGYDHVDGELLLNASIVVDEYRYYNFSINNRFIYHISTMMLLDIRCQI